MKRIFYFKFITFLFFYALSVLYLHAQGTKYPSEIIVAQDGNGNYKTIQEAVNSVRDLGEQEVKIYIKNGIYKEKLIIPSWKIKITLIGESAENTVITNADYSGKANPLGKDAFGHTTFSTYTSFTVLVQGNDSHFENLSIINSAGRVGQAVALHVEGDRFIAKHCRFLGNQDTLYAAIENSRQYYLNCYIEGTTDFIFGKATVVFQNCTIKSLSDSYVTAASTSAQQKFGFVFQNCKLIADPAVTKAYLGRPWRPYAKTVFMTCNLGKHILPEGWNPWKGDVMFPDKELTVFYAEYKNNGDGASPKTRLPWAKQLTAKEAKSYTLENILGGIDQWNPIKN
ncbi:pectinesterase family protein [Pedobacter sp. PF22-3]|uniref:pectinesterase family protein n=1 Tax=Pedobacter sp. PF22-3 TaxID=2994467 RepID=UPI002247116D|nr:pectinesterase family protein [Pedobacter sp. PF22-3]MCX2494270.1 pectinesterase family protein [Pedobacter sp. PF22-3]